MWRFTHCDCGHLTLFHSERYGCLLCGGLFNLCGNSPLACLQGLPE